MATTCRSLALRHFTTSSRLFRTPNIQNPLVPGTERRILDAVTVPVLPPDPRPLPQRCYDEMQAKKEAKKSQLLEAYNVFRLQQAIKLFNENSMVIICHILPMIPRDLFNVRAKIYTAGMKFVYVRNDLALKAIQETKLRNLEPYLVSNNVYIASERNMLTEIVNVLKKTQEIQLLGGVVDNRIMSRDDIMKAVKLPPLDIMRGELLTILSASASKTSRLLNRHQEELSVNLDQLVKQSEGLKEESREVNPNYGEIGDSTIMEDKNT